MTDSGDGQDVSRWLPPVPEGAEPPAGESSEGARTWPPQPPAPPPHAPAAAPPPTPPPPPAAGPPPGWQAPPGPAWGQPIEPENKPANIGFALSITAAGLLVLSLGVLSFVSLPLAIAGWVWGRRGVQKVVNGETRRHENLARSAVIVGIISTVLSAIALIFWIAVVATVDDFDSDDTPEQRQEPGEGRSTASRTPLDRLVT